MRNRVNDQVAEIRRLQNRKFDGLASPEDLLKLEALRNQFCDEHLAQWEKRKK